MKKLVSKPAKTQACTSRHYKPADLRDLPLTILQPFNAVERYRSRNDLHTISQVAYAFVYNPVAGIQS